MSNIRQELRRSQLVTTIGVGGLYTRQNGSSVIVCGLDFWLDDMSAEQRRELEVDDMRLRKQLRVGHLYKPISVTEDLDGDLGTRSGTIPVLRFPTWYVCSNPRCGRLSKESITFTRPIKECTAEHKSAYKFPMYQVSYVAMCQSGHLDEFPWREFVHRDMYTQCDKNLRISEVITGDPQNTKVSCECGESRKMSESMGPIAGANKSVLTSRLDRNGNEFKCRGIKPWLGGLVEEADNCDNALVPSFRGAGNVYYPFVETSLLIPEGTTRQANLVAQLRSPDFIEQRNKAKSGDLVGAARSTIKRVSDLSEEFGTPNWISVDQFSEQEISDAFAVIANQDSDFASVRDSNTESMSRTEYRYEEYRRLKEPSVDEILTIVEPEGEYGHSVKTNFANIKLVTSLTETRAFTGFARVDSENRPSLVESRKLLRRKEERIGSANDWLPAIQIKGEGIFLELDKVKLEVWANKKGVKERFDSFESLNNNHAVSFELSPQFALIHTLAHLIMKELTFFCGYSQASLRERIFSSCDPTNHMQGILIYTASGDSEGTLGGLVRMGKPGYFEEVVHNALEKSLWCSNDPVCMEKGSGVRIGADQNRLACCYACTLIPETSCEAFNNYLDRALVTGVPGKKGIGYFEDYALHTRE